MALDDRRPLIFISHVSEDGNAARQLQDHLEDRFLGAVSLFNTSARATLAPGEKWLDRIFDALKRANVLLAIMTPSSVKSPWVNFECGAAWLNDARLIPCCGGALAKESLPQPYSALQAINLGDEDDLDQLMTLIGERVSFRVPAMPTTMLAQSLRESFALSAAPETGAAYGNRREIATSRRWRFDQSLDDQFIWKAEFRHISDFEVLEPELAEIEMSFSPALEAISFSEAHPPIHTLVAKVRSSPGDVELTEPHRRTGSSYGFKIRFNPPLRQGDTAHIHIQVDFPQYQLGTRELLAAAQLKSGSELTDFRWSGKTVNLPTDEFTYEVVLPKHLGAAPSGLTARRYSNVFTEEEKYIEAAGLFSISEIEDGGRPSWLMRLQRRNPPSGTTYRLRWRLPSQKALTAALATETSAHDPDDFPQT